MDIAIFTPNKFLVLRRATAATWNDGLKAETTKHLQIQQNDLGVRRVRDFVLFMQIC